MRVLVTGSQGYIGSVLVPMLAQRGIATVGLDVGWFRECTFQVVCEDTTHWEADVREIERETLAEIDVVMHLAGVASDSLSKLNPSATFEINHRATLRLAGLARQAGVQRFILASARAPNGDAVDAPVDERGHPYGDTPYGQTQALVEREIATLACDSFSPVVLRCPSVCGVSPRLRLDQPLNHLVAVAVTRGRIPIPEEGDLWHSLVHVEDICRAFVAAATAPRDSVHNQAFTIAHRSESCRLADLGKMIAEAVAGAAIEIVPSGEAASCLRSVDFSKVGNQLPDFVPQWSAQRAICQLRDAFAQSPIDDTQLEGPRYCRAGRVQELTHAGQLDDSLRWKCQTLAHRSAG